MTKEKRLIDALGLVIKLAEKVGIMVRNGKPQAEIYSKVLECIAEASTVEAVEVVHGRWKFDTDGDPYCSVCRKYAGLLRIESGYYCHNCGAKMDGDGDG